MHIPQNDAFQVLLFSGGTYGGLLEQNVETPIPRALSLLELTSKLGSERTTEIDLVCPCPEIRSQKGKQTRPEGEVRRHIDEISGHGYDVTNRSEHKRCLWKQGSHSGPWANITLPPYAQLPITLCPLESHFGRHFVS